MRRLKQAFSSKSKRPGKIKPTPGFPDILQPQPYHHISLGSGGVLSREAFNKLIKPATFVGTTGALNTVGIFFVIDDSKCFVAHIDAHVTRHCSTEPEQKHYSTNFKTAALLREALVARLDAAVPGERTQRMRDTLIMTCGRLSGQEPRTLEAVAKTVREWLGAEMPGGGRVAADGLAFVAGWPATGNLVFQQEPADGWRAVECSLGEGAWSFGVQEAELEPSEEAW